MFFRATLALAAAALLTQTETAHAVPVQTALVLAIDGSGSITPEQFQVQVETHASLLQEVPTDGSIAIGAVQFGPTNKLIYPVTQIDSVEDRDALSDAFLSTTQLDDGTDLVSAIKASAKALLKSKKFDCKDADVSCAIDVSTDGKHTFPGSPVITSKLAVLAGIDQVNCLGIGPEAKCGFKAGKDSFSIIATSFEGYEADLRSKLTREGVIPDSPTSPVPLPAPVMLLGAGLMGLFGLRFRRSL